LSGQQGEWSTGEKQVSLSGQQGSTGGDGQERSQLTRSICHNLNAAQSQEHTARRSLFSQAYHKTCTAAGSFGKLEEKNSTSRFQNYSLLQHQETRKRE
jgi:hypothetical protein